MKLKIIYEDKDIIVIDKPAGIAVHPKDKHDNYFSIAKYLQSYYPRISKVGENSLRPGIVHRLDKETSGLLVVAKNNGAFFEFKKQFQEKKVEKRYIALVSGTLEQDEGVIKTPLVKMGTRTSARVMNYESGIMKKTRNAITEYRVLKRLKDYTLVDVRPKTGRQHQIRVHFTSINHPIACDKLYGRKAKKCPQGLNRHFLHASYLKFQLGSALMEFESELPDDLKKALKQLT